MKTPVNDFVTEYSRSGAARFHMPGHKGKSVSGAEPFDITEITGADELCRARGIILESRLNASSLFGTAETLYSTEGSSLCIRAMVFLLSLAARKKGAPFRILAGRNAHSTFVTASALLGAEVVYFTEKDAPYICGPKTGKGLGKLLEEKKPAAVYLTSPDYLGNTADIGTFARICHEHDTILAVDNAHGAYLRFTKSDDHPITLGADICCDSAHKTLPVLTGGAYLHFAKTFPQDIVSSGERAMRMFASTSPSYLIIASLDRMNALLSQGYGEKIRKTEEETARLKERLRELGWDVADGEPLKITLHPKTKGYTGNDLASELEKEKIFCEFADPDHLVLMISPENTADDTTRLEKTLGRIDAREPLCDRPPELREGTAVMSPRDAMMSFAENVATDEALGRIAAFPGLGCPPAVPVRYPGEIIDDNAISVMRYYGIERCEVVKEGEKASIFGS